MRLIASLVFIIIIGCNKNASETASTAADTVGAEQVVRSSEPGNFSGDYMIGDGVWTIVGKNENIEMRSAPTAEPDILVFQRTEHDTVRVYLTKDGSITVKMYPGNLRGMYYENDEQWEVHRVEPSPATKEETEEEESERILRERAEEDELAFNALDTYDGIYKLHTESEGAEGSLELKYKGDKTFDFKLDLKALDICKGTAEGEIFMDRTQHGFYRTDNCKLHFSFMGNWGDSGLIVEIDQPDPCDLMEGECIFTGKYFTGTAPPPPEQ